MRFLARRTVFYLLAFLIATTINFFIPRMMSGDPMQLMFARFQGRLDPRAIDALKETFGFVDGPLLEQYVTYLGNVAQGNLGLSISQFAVPVSEVIASSLGWTVRLIGLATLLSYSIGVGLGIVAAWRRGKFIDSILLPTAMIVNAFPYF